MREELEKALQTSFVNKRTLSQPNLRANLLINDGERRILDDVNQLLRSCDHFYLSIAFITQSGVTSLLQTLSDLEKRDISGKILTSDYLTFSEPWALEKLKSFSNIELRVYTKENFHAKGYIFESDEQYDIIIGSSNLTQNALAVNKEWNLKVTSAKDGELCQQLLDEFNRMWNEAKVMDDLWLEKYTERYQQEKTKKKATLVAETEEPYRENKSIEPNDMQKEALLKLRNLRLSGAHRSLIISATGTGKTYLSAFDVQQFDAKRLLFIVHREQILKQAKESFQNVIGNHVRMGLLSGNHREVGADYLFSTVQTMSKDDILTSFAPDYFDYIIIDESHRSGSKSYQKIVDYFKPQFLLGMTATPERTDGYNIYELFDHNIAYEIRLQQALEMNLLTPFHYFGVADIQINGQAIHDKKKNDVGLFKKLTSEERVHHIIKTIEYYGYSGERAKGLVFCSDRKEAKELSNKFNEHGYRTVALFGDSKSAEREKMIERLAQDKYEGGLDYIFTIDIFNEGIDIPQVNQIVMLRPTESAIIFVQQLGRGLRKCQGKEFVNIIDFISNYKNNFLIPVALSGDKSYSKDKMRRSIRGGIHLPGCSTVNFDEVAKEKIYQAITQATFKNKFLKEKYQELKLKIGYSPLMMDFVNQGDIDPMLFIDYKGSYYEFLEGIKENKRDLSESESLLLEFMYTQLANGLRPHELIILKALSENSTITISDIAEQLKVQFNIDDDLDSVKGALNVLHGDFLVGQSKLVHVKLVHCLGDEIKLTSEMAKSLRNNYFSELMDDLIAFGLYRYQKKYSKLYKDTKFKLYEKYSRRDVCRLLNWDKNEDGTVNGYPRKVKKGTIPIFVTYHKQDDISETTKYEDRFINQDIFSWMTRSNLTTQSSEVQNILHAKENNVKLHLFIKRDDTEGAGLYYFGLVDPILNSVSETVIQSKEGKGIPIVNIPLQLETPAQQQMYTYLVR